MIGVLLMSHGRMAEGILDTTTLFFGEPEKVKAICLMDGDDPEAFDDRIKEAIEELDDGSGVVAFCDLYGGTPSNRSMFVIRENPRFKVISGANLPVVMEFLGKRYSAEDIDEIDFDEVIEVGQGGMKFLNKAFKK